MRTLRTVHKKAVHDRLKPYAEDDDARVVRFKLSGLSGKQIDEYIRVSIVWLHPVARRLPVVHAYKQHIIASSHSSKFKVSHRIPSSFAFYNPHSRYRLISQIDQKQ